MMDTKKGETKMPTGYTAKIKDGITFREYALDCARAFGALIHMRDMPSDAEIPTVIEPSDYHAKEIEKTEKEISRIVSMPEIEVDEEAKAEHEKECQQIDRLKKEQASIEKKYQNMLLQVAEYVSPSSDHDDFKKFMASQIVQSIEFDCGAKYDTPVELKGSAWKANKLAGLRRHLEYCVLENQKEIQRAKERTVWVQKLFDSLPENH